MVFYYFYLQSGSLLVGLQFLKTSGLLAFLILSLLLHNFWEVRITSQVRVLVLTLVEIY